MSFESAEAVTAAAVGIAAAILAWNRWITADSMLFGLLLAGLIGLAVAGVVFLVCKVFSYYRKKRHPEAPVVSFFSSEGGMLIASPLEGKLLPLNANKKITLSGSEPDSVIFIAGSWADAYRVTL